MEAELQPSYESVTWVLPRGTKAVCLWWEQGDQRWCLVCRKPLAECSGHTPWRGEVGWMNLS